MGQYIETTYEFSGAARDVKAAIRAALKLRDWYCPETNCGSAYFQEHDPEIQDGAATFFLNTDSHVIREDFRETMLALSKNRPNLRIAMFQATDDGCRGSWANAIVAGEAFILGFWDTNLEPEDQKLMLAPDNAATATLIAEEAARKVDRLDEDRPGDLSELVGVYAGKILATPTADEGLRKALANLAGPLAKLVRSGMEASETAAKRINQLLSVCEAAKAVAPL